MKMNVNRRKFIIGGSAVAASSVTSVGLAASFAKRTGLDSKAVLSILAKRFPRIDLTSTGVKTFVITLLNRSADEEGASLTSLNESLNDEHYIVDLERYICREFVALTNVLEANYLGLTQIKYHG